MRIRFLLAGLLLAAVPAQAQIPGGTYTLGPSGGNDFNSFSDAFSQLEALGISGPVVIEVEAATYSERAQLGNVSGVSSANTITFLGIASGPTLPKISATPTGSQPYLISLSKSDYVTFDNLRFEVANENQSRGSLLQIVSNNVTVQNCEFKSIDDDSVSPSVEAINIDVQGNFVVIQDNEIDEGDIGVRYGRDGSGDTTRGGQVLRNVFDRNLSGGLFAFDQSISSGNAISIRENDVIQNAPDEAGWIGIWIKDHNRGAVIARNRIVPRSGTGILVEDVTIASTNWVSIVNNMVAGSSFGIEATKGIAVVNTDRARVLNNTVNIFDDDGTALLVDAASSGVRVVNNILVHEGTGYLLDVASGAVSDLDYQVFQSPNEASNMRVRYDGGDYTDIGDYQDDSGATNTIVWPVEFLSTADLHLAGRSDGDGRLIGQPQGSAVPSDFDGDARNATRPYRGADEAPTPLADPPPFMSGSYTIGTGGGTDYASFTDAVADLDLRGVSGPVTFAVVTNLFTEQVTMNAVPGGSVTNTIRFVGQTGTPRISHDAAGTFDNYVFRLFDARYVTFERIAFRSLDPTNADVVEVKGGGDITFDGCVFQAQTTQGRGVLLDVGGILSTTRGNADRVRVLDSTFDGGYRAMDIGAILSGVDFVQTSGHEIIGNTIMDLKAPTGLTVGAGIIVSGKTSALIQRNTIEALTSNDNFVGIEVGDGSTQDPLTDLLVEQNEVFAQNGTGIRWERFSTSMSPPGVELRLANNTVRMTGNGATIGLEILNPEDVLFAYNTVSVASPDPASAAAVVDIIPQVVSADLDLRNNLFQANAGRAIDLTVPGVASRFVYDYNVFDTAGAVVASYDNGFFDGDCADIACIRAASEAGPSGSGDQDNNSIVKTITFADPATGDLRLDPSMDGDIDLIAAVIPEVPADIDSDTRSTTDPYRGADERPTLLSFIVADPQVVLQGAHPLGTVDGFPDAMRTALLADGLVPLTNPYAGAAFDGTVNEYDGTEAVTQAFFDANPTIVDWVVTGLRETPTGPDVAKRAVFLRSNGQLLDVDGSRGARFAARADGDYHIVVYHRNHLPVMTAQAETVTSATTTSFVRMYRASEIYGGAPGAVLLEDGSSFDLYGMVAADGDADGTVDVPDVTLYSGPATTGATGYLAADYSMDGFLSAPDFNLYRAAKAAAATTSVPLPSSLARRPAPRDREADGPRVAAPNAEGSRLAIPNADDPAPEFPLAPTAPALGERDR